MKRIAATGLLSLACVAAILIIVWTIVLLDKSYAVVAAPLSVAGTIAWCIAGILKWRTWSLFLLPIYALPFAPWWN